MKRYKGKDWCTLFPDRVFNIYIGDVCYEHDMRYKDKTKSRWQADIELLKDIDRRGLHTTAVFMWIGVRLFGWIWYKG